MLKKLFSSKFINQEEIPKGFRELISDLQMHQIEIEMQKEELKQFKQEIRTQENDTSTCTIQHP